MNIPNDFPVRPLNDDDAAEDRVTCGTCGLSWDDAIATGYTPAPGGRCPFEAFHEETTQPGDDERRKALENIFKASSAQRGPDRARQLMIECGLPENDVLRAEQDLLRHQRLVREHVAGSHRSAVTGCPWCTEPT